MIKLSDYVTQFLVDKGIHDIFLVSGGGIMHLIDSVGRTPGLRYFCNYHEQACAIAAESYARTTNHVGACLVTAGPGSTNALSGIAGAWVDSIPVLVISGQVRRDLIADYARLRQFGPQEINIIDMVRPVTKYATTVMKPEMIRYELEAAYALATSGRPGPVWVNIPLDVQGAMIDESNLPTYSHPAMENSARVEAKRVQVHQVLQMILQAQRPILILGNGVRLAHAEHLVEKVVQQLGIPVIATIGGIDLMDENHPLNMGRFGPIGQRRANFALQNADLLITLGASMSVASIGFNTAGFAPKAKKIMVNIDAGELSKPNIKPDLAVGADVTWFIEEFLRQAEKAESSISPRWRDACEQWKKNYPIITPDYLDDREHVHSYVFANILSDLLALDDLVVTGNSLDIVSIYHSFKVKLGQRVFTNINFGAMGWDLPAVVGACVARGNRRTVLVTGDGSFQFNVQELETLRVNQLNVKIFILNNDGYESIRATQNNYFEGRFVGADPKSGIGNPDFAKLAEAYGLGYERIATNDEIRVKTAAVLQREGPLLCELNLSYHQERSPKTSSYRREDGTLESRPLEDMYPFLPRDEIARNMHMFDANEND